MKPKILISSCLLGNNVRYDGGNTFDSWINTKMSQYFEMVGVCPEVQMGMSVPREPVNLILNSYGQTRMISVKTKKDYTDNALNTSRDIMEKNCPDISGAILQKKSPSCGVERVKLYNEKDELMINLKNTEKNRGIFANALMANFPHLPVIDSGRLFDKNERENFLRRVYCYERFRRLDGSIRALQDFHARYKFVIMEHHQDKMRLLGNIASNSRQSKSFDEPQLVYRHYADILFKTLAIIPTTRSRTNVFFHLLGFFKNELTADEKKIIHQMVTDYNAHQLPYAVPYKMMEYLILKHQQYYLKNHYFLDQYPKELREA